MNKIIVLLSGILSFGVYAERQNAEITGLVPYESGGKKILIFKLKGNIAGGCNTTARFAIDDSKLNFDLMSSTILSSFHSKTPVQVEYNTTCNSWGNAYDARFICLGDINC
jgi:hypothetical protein